MKYIALVVLICFSVTSIAQTKLINHKSHSGTSKTFNTHTTEGNFGLPEYFLTEIRKNKKSQYKLILKDYTSGERMIEYILFKQATTKTTSSDFNKNDDLLIRVELLKESREIVDEMQQLLVKKLEKFRKEETP